MVNRFNEKDERKCLEYGRFMHDITDQQAKAIYWTLFVFVLILLYISASSHARAERHAKQVLTTLPI